MAVNDADLRSFILAEISRQCPAASPADLAGDTHLIAKGVIDSLGLLELITALEKKFSLRFDFSELDPSQLATIDGLLRCAARPKP